MSRDPRATVYFSAVALAYRARTNGLDSEAVDNLVTMASQLLDSSDQIFRAVSAFATQYQLIAHDFEALRVEGELLANTLDLMEVATPDHPDGRI